MAAKEFIQSEKLMKKREKKEIEKKDAKKAKGYKPKSKKKKKKRVKKASGKIQEEIEQLINFDDPENLTGLRCCLSDSFPKGPQLLIETKEDVEKYLKGKNWAVLRNQGILYHNQAQVKWDQIMIQIERIDSKKQYLLKPSSIFNYLDMEDKVILSSFALQKLPKIIEPPYDILRYNAAAGAAPISGRAVQIDINATYATGFYTYQTKAAKIQKYRPEEIFNRTWFFWGSQQQEYKDCLVHAVNYALKGPYFQCRDQVIRLMQRRMKYSKEKAIQYKTRAGVSIKAFIDFAIYQEQAISLEPICQFSRKKNEKNDGIEKFKEVIYEYEWEELVIATTEINCGNHTSHAFTIVRIPRNNGETEEIVLDSKEPQRKYLYNGKIHNKPADQIWRVDYFLQNVYKATIMKLSLRELTKSEKVNLEAELKGIMTGDFSELESIQILNKRMGVDRGNRNRKKQY